MHNDQADFHQMLLTVGFKAALKTHLKMGFPDAADWRTHSDHRSDVAQQEASHEHQWLDVGQVCELGAVYYDMRVSAAQLQSFGDLDVEQWFADEIAELNKEHQRARGGKLYLKEALPWGEREEVFLNA